MPLLLLFGCVELLIWSAANITKLVSFDTEARGVCLGMEQGYGKYKRATAAAGADL